MKVYIAGPMSGLPDLNYPAFMAAEEYLRQSGYEVVNPARNHAPGFDWKDYMRISIRQVMECDVIALLPGWSSSKGAVLEHRIAVALEMPVLTITESAA